MLWFLGCHRLLFIDSCGDCYGFWWRHEYTVFGVVIYTEEVDEVKRYVARIAEGLDAPCEHRSRASYLQDRYWGLVFRQAFPLFGTIMDSGSAESYTREVESRLKQMSRDNPHAGEEFRERVLYEHDWAYFRAFLDDLKIPQTTDGNRRTQGASEP